MDWMRLLFAGVAATGLSTIGCFFGPGYLFAATLAVCAGLLAARKWDWRTLGRRALTLNLVSVYPLVVLLSILFVPFPGTVSPLAWSRAASDALPGQGGVGAVDGGWAQQLLWPASSVARMAWSLCLVAVAPFLVLPRKWAFCIAMFVPAFALLIANPVTGSVLVRAVPEVFWRFYFVLPVPLCFGLLVAGLIRVLPTVLGSRSAVFSAAAAAVFVGVFIATVSTVTFSPWNMGFEWKGPKAWKLDEATVASLGPLLPQLSGKTVLVDQSAALALMDPTVKVVAQRSQNTLTAFSVMGDRAQGDRRVRAQAVAGGLADSPIYLRAFSRVLREDADAVVSTKVLWLIEPLLAKSGKEWRRAGGDSLLTVYVSGAGT